MVIALFAALLIPWFINWDDYKANFEAEAEKILGQPVRVVGSANATILPLPSLTFTKVEVGDTEGQPMMTVEKFSVTIELMPLLQGEIRVVSMRIEKPVVTVSIDDSGLVDWLIRSEASKALDPDKVVLDDVQIIDGTVRYADARTGLDLAFEHINAGIDARSLAGPWRVEGSYQEDGTPVTFQFATGRRLDDGTIRIKTDFTPARLPLAISADGIVGDRTGIGLSYIGTYGLTQVAPAAQGQRGDITGWRSEGSFTLTRDRLVVDRAVLSEGPPDRPSSLAGSMILALGRDAHFAATAEARQLDLDRSLGEGPAKPVDVGVAASSMVDWVARLPVPGIPGRVVVNIPGIVVGGAVVQDVRFAAVPEDGGWQIEGLNARLPGQATISADGTLSTGELVGFGGAVRLTVGQPATFAAWWRGRSDPGSGRLLAPFDLSGRATINLAGTSVEDLEAKIGNSTIRGSFAWSQATATSPSRTLRTNLSADRLDYFQIRAMAELLAGQNLADVSALADSYAIRFVADELVTADVTMRDVEVDASFADGGLTVSGIDIGDIGGARLIVTRGQIDDILTEPRGHLEAQLNAPTLVELARVIDRVAPDLPFTQWLNRAAPFLSPLTLAAVLDSNSAAGKPASRMVIHGSAAATSFDATIDLAGAPGDWRNGQVTASASLSSYDAFGLARQTGLAVVQSEITGGARIAITAGGVPAAGLNASLSGTFGGLSVASEGTATVSAAGTPGYAGTFSLESANIDPLIRLTGLGIPGAAAGTPVKFAGRLKVSGSAAEASWAGGDIAGYLVGAAVRVSEGTNGWPRIDGEVDLEAADLGWIAALGLGFAPLPTGDPGAPWSRTSFGEPALRGLSGRLDISAERLHIADATEITGAAGVLSFAPNRIDFDVKSGGFIGGSVAGGVSIRNVGGNASFGGRFTLVGGALDPIVWQRAGRAVAIGTLDFSTNFEATGRSPAGLVSSLTGGGTIAVHDGEARYVNPQAVALVIKSADLGQEFTEDALREQFRRFIDGDSLRFTEVEGVFAIAAGTIRLQNLSITTPEATAKGGATIDLNRLAIDSDWSLTLSTGDPKDTGNPPQIGLVFRGPLAEPERILDVLQFSSYLNIRQQERLQEILALEEAARLEKDRFNRELRRIREETARREREAAAARAARIAAAKAVEALHVSREVGQAERAEIELAEARRRAAAIEAARTAALDAAARAEAASASAKAAAESAASAAASARRTLAAASGALERAVAARDKAGTDAAAAELALANATAAREAAAKAAADALAREKEAAAGLATASAVRLAADRSAASVVRDAEAATAAADAARAAAVAASQAADTASKISEEKIEAAKAAVRNLDPLYAAQADASSRAAAAAAVDRATVEAVATAEAEAAAALKAADEAAAAARKAASVRDTAALTAAAAAGALDQAVAERDSAVAAAGPAARLAEQAATAAADTAKAVDTALSRLSAANSQAILDTTAVDAASAALSAAQRNADAAARNADHLKAAADDAAASARRKADEVAAAATVADLARADADAKARLAEAAAESQRLAETEASVKAARVNAARIAADRAKADAEAAKRLAAERASEADTATAAVNGLRTEAERAAAEFEKARAAAAAAATRLADLEARLREALLLRDSRLADARTKSGAETAARAALAAATAARERADGALAAAVDGVRTATAALAAARDGLKAAEKASTDAVAARDRAEADLARAEEAWRVAADRAAALAATAAAAAAKAAAMPLPWAIPPVGTTTGELVDPPAGEDVVADDLNEGAGPAPAVVAPVSATVPLPRPKPVRPALPAPAPLAPFDGRPLLITPVPLR